MDDLVSIIWKGLTVCICIVGMGIICNIGIGIVNETADATQTAVSIAATSLDNLIETYDDQQENNDEDQVLDNSIQEKIHTDEASVLDNQKIRKAIPYGTTIWFAVWLLIWKRDDIRYFINNMTYPHYKKKALKLLVEKTRIMQSDMELLWLLRKNMVTAGESEETIQKLDKRYQNMQIAYENLNELSDSLQRNNFCYQNLFEKEDMEKYIDEIRSS